ncbi:MAG: aspartate aminotransferase family protein [Firmicutes bacterium]|nr:aspartate aminotransferase family protein [Bacillota bacterium]
MSELRTALPKITTPLPGPKAQALIERRAKATPKAIGTAYKAVIERGEGAMFEDVDGNIFLDWIAGVGVLNIGYSHPELIEAVKAQSEKYFHSMFNITTHEPYVKLAEEMARITPVKGDEKQAFFVCSGSEADENAVKVAKNFTGRPNIIVFTGAFHGRTALTMTAKKSYAAGMGPFPDGVYRAEFPNLYRAPGDLEGQAAIDYYVKKLEEVFIEATPYDQCAAIVFEPVQGEGGFVPAPIEWVKAVRKICDEHGILMVCDEVQCGWARSGKMFASQYFKDAGCAPDIMTTAKSIAGGIPLSAIVARKEIMDKVNPGTIGGTYGANALAAVSALKVIEVMERDDYPAKALHVADVIGSGLRELQKKYPCIGDVRGTGAMMGVEFVKDPVTKEPDADLVSRLVQNAMNKGLMLEAAGTYNNVIRILSPLCVTDEQMKAGLDIIESALAEETAK